MVETTEELFKEYHTLMNSQVFSPESLDYSLLNNHLDFLNKLDAVGNSAISVFDLYKKDHVFLSANHALLFGWDIEKALKEGVTYTNQFYHPDDLIHQLQAGIYFLKMEMELDAVDKKNFKLLMEYRLMDSKGKYIRVIEQQMPLEIDKTGNLWLALGILDISPNHDVSAPFQCRAVNVKTNTLYHFPPENFSVNSPLSRREIEILQLISQGLISKQIADKLFISVNTVNTHRQRIIEKLGVSNTTEALLILNKIL